MGSLIEFYSRPLEWVAKVPHSIHSRPSDDSGWGSACYASPADQGRHRLDLASAEAREEIPERRRCEIVDRRLPSVWQASV